MIWTKSFRADPRALPLADRHYNRQKPGSCQFVPPGACLVLLAENERALWVTSWPKAAFVQHAWPGAWVNSLFRNEGAGLSSALIEQAVAATRWFFRPDPINGIVSFIDPRHVRHKRDFGRCYRKAGWTHVGYTKGGLWVYQQLPSLMPPPEAPLGVQLSLEASA